MRLLPSDPLRRGRAKLALLALLFAAPLALAWLAYWLDWTSGTSSNYGTLITPARPIAAAPLEALSGKWAWVLVSFDAAACDAYCERKLYFMRQVRRAQGKDQGRVERLWLLTDGGRPHAALLDAIQGTRVAPAGDLAARFPAAGAVSDHIYVLDPLGNLMMRFPRDPDPERMIEDLRRLLRTSRFG